MNKRAVPCSSCRRQNEEGARYCVGCGHRFASVGGDPEPVSVTERKFVTVLFLDMVGSLSLIRDKDPEDARDVLASALRVMTDAVHAYGGVVTETQGDGLMAIFGAPAAQDDHAIRACNAALRAHSVAAQGSAVSISLRIGMNSGEVVVGLALDELANAYTATGAVVHIAARVQNAAPPNTTLLTEQTAALIRDVMQVEPIGSSVLKGLPDPMRLFRLVGPIARRRVSRHLPELFVGRAGPLGALHEGFQRATRGEGAAFALIGEAGIGKTAVIDQFLFQCRHAGTAARSRADHHTSVAPLQPLTDIVAQLLEISDVMPSLRAPVVGARLAALGLDRAALEPPLFDLLAVEGPAQGWFKLSAANRHDLVRSAVVELLVGASRMHPLLIAIEDLQRSDSATIALIDQIIRSIGQERILLVLAFRPELAHDWQRNENFTSLPLGRLDTDVVRLLIASTVPEDLPPRVVRQLASWSNGNPLFLREGIRAMIEGDAIVDAEAAARIPFPSSIGTAIAARIDRLPRVEKRVLLAASVLGKQFAVAILGNILQFEEDTLALHLDALVASDFIHSMQPGSDCAFQHGLYQEVCYSTLPRRQRRDLHQAAFLAFRRLEREVGPVEAMAQHAYGGELWAEAVVLCREAGRRAAARSSNREAALHLERAIEALARADVAGHRLEEAIAIRLELRAVSIPLLRLDRVESLLTEAQGLAERSGNVAQLARVTAFRAGNAYLTRNSERCIELCRAAMRLAADVGDPQLLIAPSLYLAQANYALGRYRRSVAILGPATSMQDAELSGEAVGLPLRPAFMRTYWIAIAQAEIGRFDDAEALVAEMVAQADPRHPFESLYALTAQGFVLMLRGELAGALEVSSSALASADEHDIIFIVPVLASQVGFLLATQGRAKEGVVMGRRALRKAEEIGGGAGLSRWSARVAETCLRASDLDEARGHADAAIRIASGLGELGYLCSAWRLSAKIHAAAGHEAAAVTDIGRAAQVARDLRLGPALAKCYFDWGVLAHRAGDRAGTRRAYHKARTGFARYRMCRGVETTEAAIAGLDNRAPGPGAEVMFGSAE